ncbi:hypothetical protein [Bdellovibrio sp. HCB2-146]|uniref:hypothetical protein n=1 Tax=Bdellovibrio sp. HCB2-146 TaxID=3394362 RepID=UPI0039BD14AB
MFVTKILEKKGVIQTFGVAMILAPFINSLTRLFVSHAASERTFSLYWRYLTNKPAFLLILALLTIANGVLMLRGQKSAWRFTLFVLGAYIVHQVLNFAPNFRESWVAALYLGINILAFAFIVDQLVWKVEAPKRPQKAQPQPVPTVVAVRAPEKAIPVREPQQKTPLAVVPLPSEKPTVTPLRKVKSYKSKRRILLSFGAADPWAQVTGISSLGFQVKCLLPQPPSGIESREVEFKLNNGLLLKARLTDSKNGQYLFKYTNASSSDITRLNQWLRDIA